MQKICRKCAGKSGSGRRRTGRRSDPGASAQSPQRAYRERSDSASNVLEHVCGGDEEVRYGHAEYVAARSIFRRMRCGFARLAGLAGALHPGAWAQISSAANCARRKYRLTGSGGRPVEPPSLMFRSKNNRPCLHDVDLSHSMLSGLVYSARACGFKACTNGRAGTCLLPTIYRHRIDRTPGWSSSINSTPAASSVRRIAARLLIEGTRRPFSKSRMVLSSRQFGLRPVEQSAGCPGLIGGHPGKWSARAHTPRMCAGGEQQRHR